ncbi:MAG: hypothetical protein KC550_07205 [Nanoarchaeota archaeon]|nr:hypothetical protein [Nanoarchaeota archaeon]
MNIKNAEKWFHLSRGFILNYLDPETDYVKGKFIDINEIGLKKLSEYKTKYIRKSEFINQGILTPSQLQRSTKIHSKCIKNYGGTIGWIMLKSDFEEIKKDLEERRKLK